MGPSWRKINTCYKYGEGPHTSRKVAGFFLMKEYYYMITESMLDLGLRGTELNLFAVIYGFSQRGGGCCYLKQDELAKWCGVTTRQTINSALKSLIEKGLVRKFIINKDGKDLVAYSYTEDVKKFDKRCKKFLHTDVKKLPEGSQNILHMDNIRDNEEDNTPLIPHPTPEEVSAYVCKLGFKDAEGFGHFYVGHFENTGWIRRNGEPLVNWKNNIREVWMPRNKDKDFSVYRPVKKQVSTISISGL